MAEIIIAWAGSIARVIFVVLIAFAVVNTSAQHLPPELTFPRASEEGADTTDRNTGGEIGIDSSSPILYFSTSQNIHDRSVTSTNSVIYTPNIDSASLEQGLQHEARRDRLGNLRHYVNASGSLFLPMWGNAYITPGLDWTPIAQYSSDGNGRNSLATLDAGPTAKIDAAGLPVFVRGGVSGRRVDSLASFIKVGDYRSSVGAYGGVKVGSEEETLPWAPVYFYADGLGRRIENSGMANLTSSALGAARVGENDSLFVYGSASLFNGKEGYLEESADSRAARFAETPWRIEHTWGFTAGFKAAPRSIFEPSVYYGVEENALEFPNDTRKRDERTIRQTLSGALSTDSSAGLYYSGSIGFTWRDHDKLFGRDNNDISTVATESNRDSLDVNLWDYAAFEPRTAHRLVVKLPLSTRLKYDFSLSRFLTEYPNYYTSGGDTVTNSDDSDRRTAAHRLALEYRDDSVMRVEVFGELTEYDLVFLRSAKSSSNRTDYGQKAGIIFEWSPVSDMILSEALAAEAKRGEFHFPQYHQKALQRPRYSRAVSSTLSCDWQTTERFGLRGEWHIKYSDYGFWYGREYMDTVLSINPNARVDYYAITSRSVYTTADIAARVSAGSLLFEAGNVFTSARDHNFSEGNYILADGNAYSLKPYLNAGVSVGGNTEIEAHISRTFVVGNKEGDYWEIKLQAEGWF